MIYGQSIKQVTKILKFKLHYIKANSTQLTSFLQCSPTNHLNITISPLVNNLINEICCDSYKKVSEIIKHQQ